MNDLSPGDFEFVLSALDVFRRKIEETQYPAYEMRRERLDECERVTNRVREMRNRTKKEAG